MNTKSKRREYSRREFLAQGTLYGGAMWMSVHASWPSALAAAAASTEPVTLSDHQWRTLEAITGRIIPTDQEPGAIEANCVNFIDKALAHEESALKTMYEVGLACIDKFCRASYGEPFAELDFEQQDGVLDSLESGHIDGWSAGDVEPATFFATVRTHTITSFLADPRHGGNREYSGWKVIGYPGPRHGMGGFTPQQMLGEAPIIAVWGEEI